MAEHEAGVTRSAGAVIDSAEIDRGDIERTHALFDRANIPRTSVDNHPLTLEQRATILVHWYQGGSRR